PVQTLPAVEDSQAQSRTHKLMQVHSYKVQSTRRHSRIPRTLLASQSLTQAPNVSGNPDSLCRSRRVPAAAPSCICLLALEAHRKDWRDSYAPTVGQDTEDKVPSNLVRRACADPIQRRVTQPQVQ